MSGLRELAAKATPGPWDLIPANARLVALAPEMAALLADMANAMQEATGGWTLPGDLEHDYKALLARYAALNQKAAQ